MSGIAGISCRASSARRQAVFFIFSLLAGLALLSAFALTTTAAATGCFSSPSSCGYPDATNTGVPQGTSLTASGSRTVSTNGATLSGLDLNGTVTVAADNVTIEKSRITRTSGGSGSYAVIVNKGADNFTIKDTEVVGPAGDSNGLESAVWNHYNNPGATAIRVYFRHCADCWEGAGTFRDSYMVVDAAFPGSHNENIYACGAKIDVDHSTMVNTYGQTATVFGDAACGPNRVVVTDSLLAGGGYLIYPQANSDRRMGSMKVSRNRFARCRSTPVFDRVSGGTSCARGADSHGAFPNGGYYGVAAYYYLGPGQVWRKNVWDDNGKAVCLTGSCRG